jgi:hypothetical protein
MARYILFYDGDDFEGDVKRLSGLEGSFPGPKMAIIISEREVGEINQILSPRWYAKKDLELPSNIPDI